MRFSLLPAASCDGQWLNVCLCVYAQRENTVPLQKVRLGDKGRGHMNRNQWLVENWSDASFDGSDAPLNVLKLGLAWFSVTEAVIYTFLCRKGCKTGVNYILYNLKINDAFTVTQVEAHLHFQSGMMMSKWKLDLCVNEKCLFYQWLWKERERDGG